ncbi:MAG: aldo/keto reductase [SAR202 cluster bacterium]|nr:aldo/keto reductase [SAR202 cluster bacterium]|tara:strand:- start:1887 stop:2879 length:993 start_codon:yes stop_codon:yes gene_type:complete
MNYRKFGNTGIEVSEIGFGCGDVGGLMVRGEHADQVRAVARAMELGINYFDTASRYGGGQSETNLGQVLKELSAEVYVGTKYSLGEADPNDLKAGVIQSVEASLKRLGREQVDLIQLHDRISSQTDVSVRAITVSDVLGEVREALEVLKSQGKVRFYGMTGVGEPKGIHEVVASGLVSTVQTVYNLINASAGAAAPAGFDMPDYDRLIDLSAEKNVGVIVIRVLAAGALTGTSVRHPVAVQTVAPIGSGRDFQQDESRARQFAFIVNEGFASDMPEASIRFALSNPGVSTVLVGYSDLEHLEKSVQYAAKGPLLAEALARLPQAWSTFVS